MKNRYIAVSAVLLGLSLYSLPQSAAAQLLTRANTPPRQDVQPYDTRPARTRSLKKALTEVERKYGVNFAYDEQLLDGHTAAVDLSGTTLEQTLDHLLTGQGLRFRKIKDNLIIILAAQADKTATSAPLANPAAPRPEPARRSGGTADAAAQTQEALVKRITGRITDENGQGLPGANVIEKGTNTGTTTDANGSFQLNVSDGATALVISSVGYQRQEVAIGAQSVVNVQLVPDNRTLDEVVVVAYGTQKRANITEAVSTVNVAEARKVQAASVVDQVIGRIPGVTVTSNSGAPGATGNLKVRGTSTFSGADGPIYVIDGIITGNASADVNPNDIETFTVLKDAAATALYGSRGMNGAVVITTRRGKAGATRVDVNSYYGVQNITRRIPFANAQQFIGLATTAYRNAGLAVPNFRQGVDTDWQSALIKPGAITDNNVNVSGGSENGTYNVSLGHFYQDGTIVGPYFRRTSLRVNSDLGKGRLRFGESVGMTRMDARDVNGLPFEGLMRMPPTIPIYDPNNLSGYGYGDPNNNTFGTNPIGQQLKDDNKYEAYKVLANVYGNYSITDWLSYRLSLNLELYDEARKIFTRPGALSQNAPQLPFSVLDDTRRRYLSTIVENTLNFNKTFGKHGFTGLLGYTWQRAGQNVITAHTEGIQGEFQQQGAGTSNTRTSSDSFTEGLISYLGRVTYDYDNRYFVQVNVRRDASSKFPKSNQAAWFPGASLGWRISGEPFFQVPAIDDLKLRASYGTVGNQAIPNYELQATLDPNINYVLGPGQNIVPGAINRQYKNPNLRWESKTTTDVGFDLSMFKGRFTATFDVFESISKNLLLRVPVPYSLGSEGDAPFDNVASIQNRGLELGLSYNKRASQPGGLEYSIGGQITSIRNKALGLIPANGNLPIFGFGGVTRTAVGGPIAGFYVLQMDGIFQTQEEINNSAQRPVGPDGRDKGQGIIYTPGDVRWRDTNGDGQINFDDRVVVGQPFPTFEYGLNFSAKYRGFDLSLLFQGVSGNKIFNNQRYWTDRGDDIQNFRTDITFWTGPGSSNTAPKLRYQDPTLNPKFNTSRWIEDGAYGRLRNLQIGYTIPTTTLQRFKMNQLRVYVSAQNLFTITKYSGYNPDITGANGSSDWFGRGVDVGNYPVARILSAGLQLGF